MTKNTNELLAELNERIRGLEHEAELIKTVLIVKEPTSVPAANAYDGLRKQIVAAAAERRAHLSQLVAMAVAVSRATSVRDLEPQVAEWMQQAGVVPVWQTPAGEASLALFEDTSGAGLEGPIEVQEPAYADAETGALLRMGRARLASAPSQSPLRPAGAPPAPNPSDHPVRPADSHLTEPGRDSEAAK